MHYQYLLSLHFLALHACFFLFFFLLFKLYNYCIFSKKATNTEAKQSIINVIIIIIKQSEQKLMQNKFPNLDDGRT